MDLHQRNRLALDHLGMSFSELLPLVEGAAAYLEHHTVQSKEKLDQALAQLAAEQLPAQKQSLWNAPSMYGAPDRQTVGGAAVSFLLRPCSFKGLVVFGEREGISPTFTSPLRWLGHKLVPSAQGTASLHAAFCTPTVPRRRAPLPSGWAALPLRQSGSGSRSRRSLNR